MLLNRRGILAGLVSALVSPMIVRAESLMPVKVYKPVTLMSYGINTRSAVRWVAFPGEHIDVPGGMIWDMSLVPRKMAEDHELTSISVLRDTLTGKVHFESTHPVDVCAMVQDREGKMLTPVMHQFTVNGCENEWRGRGIRLDDLNAVKEEGDDPNYLSF